jgi:ornithine cyclodeaminase
VPILILSEADVRDLLPPADCVPVMRAALLALAAGEAHQPLRMVVQPPGAAGLMAVMPSYLGGVDPQFGLKAVNIFHGNPARGLDSHQGAVLLCDGSTGETLALANGAAITELRTAAVSAVATDALARPDAGDLAIIGSGVQARAHLAAIAGVRNLSRVRVASRRLEHAQRFAAEQGPQCPVEVEVCESVEAAVAGADIVVTATNATEPVLRREWLTAGAHVNAVGASLPGARELDSATVATARLFVDRRESALNESGDYLLAARDGLIGPAHIRAELGEVLAGTAPGRTGPEEITLFKSLGLAVEDLATIAHLYRVAKEQGTGTWVEF